MRLITLLLLLCLQSTITLAQGDEKLPPAVSRALKAAGIPTAPTSSAMAILVQEVGASSPRLAVNAGVPLNPASLMKLLTTLAALETLGPAYTWKTELLSLATPADGVLAGDLILRGSGDPKLTQEQFWLLLKQLRLRGVREIRGNLILDHGLFDLGDYDPARFDDQPLRPYNVGPDALLLNFKAIRVSLIPDTEKRSVLALPDPLPANLDVVNLIKLGNNGCGDWKEGLRADVSRHGERYRLALTGSYSASCGEKNWNLSVLPHSAFVAGLFRQTWQDMGGSLIGEARDGKTPPGAKTLAAIESPSLAEVVRDINKYSNNVMARQLYLTLGLTQRQPTRAEDADRAIRAWLGSRDLRLPELVLENGSGLSRRERISAEGLMRVLQTGWKSPVMPEYIASLPLSAVDGTMKKRLHNNGVAGQAHIKTGTLEGVKGIAGYVLDRNGKMNAVVFLVNHTNASASQAAQDALLQWVYEGAK